MEHPLAVWIIALALEIWTFGKTVECTSYYRAISITPPISQIPSNIPNNTTHVTITGNRQLASLAGNVFENTTSLTHADFSSNGITFVDPDTFKGTVLHTVILYDNYLTRVPFIDYVASTLKVLDLRWNRLFQIPEGSLDTFPSLLELDLSFNPLLWSSVTLNGLSSVTSSLNKLKMDRTTGPLR